MRTTWEKIFHHVGTIYRHNISDKLQNKVKFSIPKPGYTEYLQSKHKQHMKLLNLQSASLSEAMESNRVMLTQSVKDGNDLEAPINMSILENEINESTYKASIDPATHITDAF